MSQADQMIGRKRGSIGVIAAEGRHIDLGHRARDQDGRHAIVLGEPDIGSRRSNGRRHDHAIAAQLQQGLNEMALFLD